MSDNNNQFDQPISGHDYDGIQEFDNPLPMWWLWTFFGTIIFSFIYFIHYEFKIGPSSDQELASDMAAIEKLQTASGASTPKMDLSAAVKDPKMAKLGAALFTSKCLVCHGNKGQGSVGPNLTDKFWIYGAKPEEILTVIANGAANGSMPPWKETLKPEEMQQLIAFIYSIKGSNPEGALPPKGNEVPDYY